MIRLHKHISRTYLLLAALAALSCDKEERVSSLEIEVTVENAAAPATRAATLFDGKATLTGSAYGGREFTMSAYLSGSDDIYFSDECVHYYTAYEGTSRSPWQFWTGTGIVRHVWPPQSGALDFFAYVPYEDNLATAVPYIDNIDYSAANGPSFECDLPITKAKQDLVKEFIYAYHQGVTSVTSSCKIKLEFQHPFAAVSFRLQQGHRNMTIHEIALTNIHSQGTFTWANTPQWDATDSSAGNDLYVPIAEGAIPSQINFGAIIDGPFIVLPQDLAVEGDGCTQLKIKYSWSKAVDPIVEEYMYVPIPNVDWESGRKYTYNIDMGDNKEEIMFKVTVEAWDIEEYHIPIDVE